jgi:hypothetical protein
MLIIVAAYVFQLPSDLVLPVYAAVTVEPIIVYIAYRLMIREDNHVIQETAAA